MNTCSLDIRDMLVEEDIGLVFAENLFISREPANPSNCVTIYDAPGGSIDLTAAGVTERYYRHDVQVRIRNADYLDGWQVAYDIVDRLHARAGEVWGDTYYALIECTSPPFVLEYDDNNRVIFIANFSIQRRED